MNINENIEELTKLEINWSWDLIALSYLVSVYGSFTTLQILAHLSVESGKWRRQLYFTSASISMGGIAIWCMHFVGMLAISINDIDINYNIGLTVLSGLVAIISCRVGFLIMSIKMPQSFIKYLGEDKLVLFNLGTTTLDELVQQNQQDYNNSLHDSREGLQMDDCTNGIFNSSPIYHRRYLSKNGYSPLYNNNIPIPPPFHLSGQLSPPAPNSSSSLLLDDNIHFNQLNNQPQQQQNNNNNNNNNNNICNQYNNRYLSSIQQQSNFGNNSSNQSSTFNSPNIFYPIDIDPHKVDGLMVAKHRSNFYQDIQYKLFSKKLYNKNILTRMGAGGFFCALGITGMHYIGMMAMEMNAVTVFNFYVVGLSFLIAWAAAFAALMIAAFAYKDIIHLISSLFMGLAVCGMHYIGIYSAQYYYKDFGYQRGADTYSISLMVSMLSIIFGFLFRVITSSGSQKKQEQIIQLATELTHEKCKSDALLNSILPIQISSMMKKGDIHVAEECAGITIIFADIVDFTKMSSNYTPKNLVLMLNRIYSLFDDLTESMNLEKIKTIGDSYMCVSGLPWHHIDGLSTLNSPNITTKNSNPTSVENISVSNTPTSSSPFPATTTTTTTTNQVNSPPLFSIPHQQDNIETIKFNAQKSILFAAHLLELVDKANEKYGYNIHLRIGINTGEAVAGVIGKKKFSFDLWGDTVNIASRIESLGIPDCVCMSKSTYELVCSNPVFFRTSTDQVIHFEEQIVNVKGKGDMPIYILNKENANYLCKKLHYNSNIDKHLNISSSSNNIDNNFLNHPCGLGSN